MATHWPETNDVIKRNRRIGCSQSGIQEAILKFGRRKYLDEYRDRAYTYIQYVDRKTCSIRSRKTTSVKPSGTVSLVAGALPGFTMQKTILTSNRSTFCNISDGAISTAGYRMKPHSIL